MKAQKLSEIDYVVFDTETTGLYPETGDEIIEIGAVRVQRQEVSSEVFQSFINPGRDIPEASSQVHGIYEKDVRSAPAIDEVIHEFCRFGRASVWVAQNARFDLGFLMKAFDRNRISVSNQIVLDTIGLSKILFPYETKHNLDVIMARLGIGKTGSRHRSVDDSRYTAQVLIQFIELLEKQGMDSLQSVSSAMIRMGSLQKSEKPKTASLF